MKNTILIKIMILFCLVITAETYASDLEIQAMVGANAWTPDDYGRFKKISNVQAAFTLQTVGSISGIGTINFPLNARFTSTDGRWGAYGSYVHTNLNPGYKINTLIPLSVGVKPNLSRNDMFLDAIFYYLPFRAGVGLGYRDTGTVMNDSNFNIFSGPSRQRDYYQDRGLQLSHYFILPVDKNISIRNRISVYYQSGAFQTNSLNYGLVPDTTTGYNYQAVNVVMANNMQNTRRGVEVDLKFVMDIHRNFQFYSGIMANWGQVKLNSYNPTNLIFTAAPSNNQAMNIMAGALTNSLIAGPMTHFYNDTIYSIYFGFGVALGDESTYRNLRGIDSEGNFQRSF